MNNSDTGTVMKQVIEIVREMTADFDAAFSGEVTPDTLFVADLDFHSVDVIELIAVVERRFGRKKLPFQKLIIKNGRYADFTVGELAAFLAENLPAPPAGAAQ